MPQTPHVEKHFTASETVRDVVIGMSDGLTVPFALAAGLSGAVQATGIVVTAGVAEIAAGSIAMGLGGYLAAKTDAEHFASERAREVQETYDVPEVEAAEVAEIFRNYGLDDQAIASAVAALRSNRDRWVDFMMRFELGLEEPDPKRAAASALTIAPILHRRRIRAAVSLHRLALAWLSVGAPRAHRLDRDHHHRALRVRLYQRAVHHAASLRSRLANGRRWRLCGGHGLYGGQADRLMADPSARRSRRARVAAGACWRPKRSDLRRLCSSCRPSMRRSPRRRETLIDFRRQKPKGTI